MALLGSRSAITTLADGDLIHAVDVSDTTSTATGTSKKITAANLKADILDDPTVTTALTLSNGIGLRTNTTTGHTAVLQAYDVDGAAYKSIGVLTNGNVPSLGFWQLAGTTLTWDGGEIGGTTPAAGHFTDLSVTGDVTGLVIPYTFALSDETTAITTGTAKLTWRAPFACTLSDVRASLTTVSTSGIPTVDINEGGTTVLSTKLTIDANEKTSTTAATAPVISDSAIADDAEITFDIDVAGTGAAGLKVTLYLARV